MSDLTQDQSNDLTKLEEQIIGISAELKVKQDTRIDLTKLEEKLEAIRVGVLKKLGDADDLLQRTKKDELTEIRIEILEEIEHINDLLLRAKKVTQNIRSHA